MFKKILVTAIFAVLIFTACGLSSQTTFTRNPSGLGVELLGTKPDSALSQPKILKIDFGNSDTNTNELRAKLELADAITKIKNKPNCPWCSTVDGGGFSGAIGTKAVITSTSSMPSMFFWRPTCPLDKKYYNTITDTCLSRSQVINIIE